MTDQRRDAKHAEASPKRSPRPNALATVGLDRLSDQRKDEAWINDQWADRSTRVHVQWQGHVVVLEGRANTLDPGSVSAISRDSVAPVLLLGSLDGVSHFAVDASHLKRAEVEALVHEDAMLTYLREAAPVLAPDDANMSAMASGLITWHSKHRFCGSCGAATASQAAGHERKCTECGTIQFPRTDPAVIMLVSSGDGGRCVLGRQKVWPQGMYSTLAGFVEPGESLEDAVAREVYEEVGLRVDSVVYGSSQPWPFPQSLMLGFHAIAVTEELHVHPEEMEDARWFSRDELLEARTMGRRGFPAFPPSIAISRRLIDDWLDGEV